MDRVVVIGVGNRYRRDDGVGPAVVDLLRHRSLPMSTRLEYSLGDTADLMELWSGADVAILVDAARPVLRRPGAVHHTVSSHALPMGQAIELARALGRMPKRLELFAVEIEDSGHGEGLTPKVHRGAQRVASAIAAEVKRVCALPTRPK